MNKNLTTIGVHPGKHGGKNNQNESEGYSHLIYIFFGVFFLAAIVTVVLIIFYQMRKASSKRKLWLNKELAKECQYSPVYINAENLSQTIDEFQKDEETATTFLFEKIGSKESDLNRETNGETKEIPTCNDPSIHCLNRTQIQFVQPSKNPKLALNMNVLHDFYLTPIYVGQVPVSEEFEAFWQAVDEFDVGIVVWFNSASHNGGDEEYHIPIRQMYVPEKYGAYLVRNVNVLSFVKEFKIYEIEYLRGGKFVVEKTRKLFVFEIDSWPCDAEDEIQSDKLTRIVKNVDTYYQKQKKQQTNEKMKSIMIQCENGIEQSVTFVALYICRQMWLSVAEINPIGVMRYIRNCRHGAFTKSTLPGKQLLIVYFMLLHFIKDTFNDTKQSGKGISAKENKSAVVAEPC